MTTKTIIRKNKNINSWKCDIDIQMEKGMVEFAESKSYDAVEQKLDDMDKRGLFDKFKIKTK